eukprot:TRINITY_DN82352_c0_g1_i1.p1 TRINITY_DN82352_c0_g1~~TRINITY_DN82352_c0_g1_i1.p1  ORF type:complete len:329 (+),score=121.56 TRINITY_DN82352_c0_g1_i1:105-1091(+)
MVKKKTVSKSELERFLQRGIDVMKSDAIREELKDKKASPRPGKKLIEIQLGGWDEQGIDRDAGKKELDGSSKFADEALMMKRMEFVVTAMHTYLQSLRDRRPPTLEGKKKIPRDVILEFFDACNTNMDLPEFQQELVLYAEKHSKPPNQLIIDTQREWLEVLGWEKDHGCQCLGAAGDEYGNDEEIKGSYMHWKQKAEHACVQALQRLQAKKQAEMMNSPEYVELRKEATESIEKMSPKERGGFLEGISKKFQVFMSLPDERRRDYIAKQSRAERVDFVKAQILTMSLMRQNQMNAMQQGQAPPGAQTMGGGGYAPQQTSSAPSQQTM